MEINKFVEILDCVAILRLNSAVWTAADHANVMNWFRLLYTWYNTNTLGIQARDATKYAPSFCVGCALWRRAF